MLNSAGPLLPLCVRRARQAGALPARRDKLDLVNSDSRTGIEVFQDRQWAGDPRLGTFTLYLDGTRAGLVRPLSKLRVDVEPGPHSLKTRQWWYRSPVITVEVEAGEVVRLKADGPKGRNDFSACYSIPRPHSPLSRCKRKHAFPWRWKATGWTQLDRSKQLESVFFTTTTSLPTCGAKTWSSISIGYIASALASP